MAASVVVLVAATLLTRTFVRLNSEPLGFASTNLWVASVMLPNDPFDTADERNLYYRQLRDRLISRPGVSVVAASTLPPLTSGAPVAVDTGPADSPSAPRISAQDVTPTFFAGLEIPLVAGRVFDARDTAAAAPVIVVNARAAQQIFGRPSAAVGQRVRLDSGPWREIVGVVGNVRSSFFNTLEWRTDPIVYRPAAQSFVSVTPSAASFGFFLHVRSERALTMADIRDTAHAVSARAAVTEVQRVSDLVGVATRQPALRMALLSGFAVAGLLLAAIGVYGIVSQAVGRRLREIAVRIALGAAPVRVVATMTVGALVTGVAGLAVGILLALVLSRTFEALLYGVGSRDLVSFVVSGMALLIVTVVAALIPAWRAARVDPMRVLRAE
jgi:putative ABC transport system permease protein